MAVIATSVILAGCVANPGPPPVVEPQPETATSTTTTTSAPASQRTEIQVGVETLRNGLNPHLLSDESALVQSIANLVLPSAFVDGELNAEVLQSAEEIATSANSDVVQTVRYVIDGAAQWSDGTPLTGADFVYLWQRMRTTPGVINPEAYRAIRDIRVTGAAAKTVDVDFSQPVANWQELFNHLVPSHLLGSDAESFTVGLRDDIPASAGRYMVVDVDRGRGVITLNRNDRFWGDAPAPIDILTLATVRSTTHSADQLRTGQIQFVDTMPGETTRDTYALIPDVEERLVPTQRTLGITLSTTSPILQDHALRTELRSLIDVPLIARLGAGRSTDLLIPDHHPVSDAEPELLPVRISHTRPLRFAADPADPVASAAVRSLVDLLGQRGIEAEVVSTDMLDIAINRLPNGSIDGVVSRESATGAANYLASQLRCPDPDLGFVVGNLSGLCTPEYDQLASDILAGRVTAADGTAALNTIRDIEATWIPLIDEQRLIALTPGIVVPNQDLPVWTGGLSTAGSWRLPETTTETTTATPSPTQTATIAEENDIP